MAPNWVSLRCRSALIGCGEDAEDLPVEEVEDVGESRSASTSTAFARPGRRSESSKVCRAGRMSRSTSCFVLINAEADPQHVAANVGDAVLAPEAPRTSAARSGCGRRGSGRAGLPSSGLSSSASPSAVAASASSSCVLKRGGMSRDSRGRRGPSAASMRCTALKRYSAEGSKVAPRKRRASFA